MPARALSVVPGTNTSRKMPLLLGKKCTSRNTYRKEVHFQENGHTLSKEVYFQEHDSHFNKETATVKQYLLKGTLQGTRLTLPGEVDT